MVRFSGTCKTLNGAQRADVHRNLSKNYLQLGNNYGIGYGLVKTYTRPGPARPRKIQLLQPNYRPGCMDCDQQQRARSLKLSYSCKIRDAVPFRKLYVPPFRRLSYSGKIRNETQSFRSAVPFRSGNYTFRRSVDYHFLVKSGTRVPPFRSGNYHILVKSGTQFRSVPEIIRSAVPFRKLSYSFKIRNTVPFRSGNYTFRRSVP